MVGRTVKSISFDARKARKEAKKSAFQASKSAETAFYRSLKKVAQNSGQIIEAYTVGASITDLKRMTKLLEDYAEAITPWAKRQSLKLLDSISKTNKRQFKKESVKLGKALQAGVGEGETGRVAMALMNEQVALIKSIPIETGLRAQKIAADNFLQGTRAVPDKEIVDRLKKEMGMSTEVAVNRAKLIARTETARASASFVQARAVSLGSKGYIWRASMDGATRESHAEMNGKYVPYGPPPLLSDGTRTHAGEIYNCRCYQDPVLPDLDD